MHIVNEVQLKNTDELELELPVGSEAIGVAAKANRPVVLIRTPVGAKLTTRIRLVVTRSGVEFGSMIVGDKPQYVGTIQRAVRIPNPEVPEGEPVVVAELLHIFIFKGASSEASGETGSPIIL